MDDQTTRKVLSVISHASLFINSLMVGIGVPIVVLILSEDRVVQDNAREALNFHINLLIGWAIAVVFFFSVVGIPVAFVLSGLLLVISFVMPIIAIVQTATQPEIPYRYPFVWHIL